MRLKHLAYGLPLLGIGVLPAHALVIVANYNSVVNDADYNAKLPSDDSTLSAADQVAINQVISSYETEFSNPTTVYINFVGDSSISLGQSFTSYGTVSYTSYRNALLNTQTNAAINQDIANSLPSSGNPVPGNGPGQTTATDNSGNLFTDGSPVTATFAQLRTLGFNASSSASNPDSTISINTTETYDPQNGIISNYYDIASVASHEINEVLGLNSALDGLKQGAAAPTNTTASLDFFRYSAPGMLSFDTNSSTTSYLSADNGNTKIVGFNQDAGGDFHDWYSVNGVNTPRVQDAFGTPGVNISNGPAEFTALQLLGYNSISAAPEPSSFADLGLLAFGLGGLLWKSRKRQAKTLQA